MKLKTEIPEEMNIEYQNGILKVTDGKKEVEKELKHARVNIEIKENQVIFQTNSDKKNIQSIVKTFQTHLKNMIEGLQEPHIYKLKGVYAHFPMDIKKQGNELVIENFMGERNPRKTEIPKDVQLKVEGEDLTVKGVNKEKVSQTAARIEQLCRKGDRDPRTFQDGIYITEVDTNE